MTSIPYAAHPMSPEQARALTGAVVLQFGTDWCGHCQAAEPWVTEALARYPNVTRYKVEDGRGRPLGRSFQVRLWPTLVCLVDGVEVARVVRPTSVGAVLQALQSLVRSPA